MSVLVLIVVLPVISFLFLLDFDNDGIYGLMEINSGTSIFESDTDHDGVLDGDEIARALDPLSSDTDGDGVIDGDELRFNTNPLAPDTDGDSWNDYYELFEAKTSATQEDTDGDWIIDSVDSNPTDFFMPEGYRILSHEFYSTEHKEKDYANRATSVNLRIAVTRKPTTSEDLSFLMEGSFTVDGEDLSANPSINFAKEEDTNPVVEFRISLGYLLKGPHVASYRNFTLMFETERFTFPATNPYLFTGNEMTAIEAETISSIAPNKYFGLALVFGAKKYHGVLGLRIYAFKGCSIETKEAEKTKEELDSVLEQILVDTAYINLQSSPPRTQDDKIFEAELKRASGYWHTESHPEYRMYYGYVDFAFYGKVKYGSIDFTSLQIPEKYVSVTANALNLITGKIPYVPLFVYLSFPSDTVTVLREIWEGNSILLNEALPIFAPWESRFSKYPTEDVYYRLNAMSLSTTFLRLLYGDISELPSAILYGVAFYDLRLVLGKVYFFN